MRSSLVRWLSALAFCRASSVSPWATSIALPSRDNINSDGSQSAGQAVLSHGEINHGVGFETSPEAPLQHPATDTGAPEFLKPASHALKRRADVEGGTDVPEPTGETPRQRRSRARQQLAKLSAEEREYVKALQADRTTYTNKFLGKDKAGLRAELRALAPDNELRQEYEYLKARYAALRYWEANLRLPPPEKDPGHPVHQLRRALRREVAALPPGERHELSLAFWREYGGRSATSAAARKNDEALPLNDAQRVHFERLYAANLLEQAERKAAKTKRAALKKQRDAFERRFLGESNAGKRAALEREEGGKRALQTYRQLKQAYEQWEAEHGSANRQDGGGTDGELSADEGALASEEEALSVVADRETGGSITGANDNRQFRTGEGDNALSTEGTVHKLMAPLSTAAERIKESGRLLGQAALPAIRHNLATAFRTLAWAPGHAPKRVKMLRWH